MHDIALVPLLFAAALGLGTTSSCMLGAAIGLYCPLSKRVLACVLAFAAGALISGDRARLSERAGTAAPGVQPRRRLGVCRRRGRARRQRLLLGPRVFTGPRPRRPVP